METPLTPLEFARRARRLYGDREGVVDGALRLSYHHAADLGNCVEGRKQQLTGYSGLRPPPAAGAGPRKTRHRRAR
jgi:hypothetical protein